MAENKTGTREWSKASMNIQRGCEHDCRYCYGREMAVRYNRCRADQWPYPAIDEKKVDKPHTKQYGGVVMYPTTHDVTPTNINQYMTVLRKLLDAGNNVLIVSKPHLECIRVICKGLEAHKGNMEFRFTIGSTSDDVLKFWEPNAPGFIERVSCLEYAYAMGYKTSVSCEPLLDGFVLYTYQACIDFISESFWVGLMNKIDQRCDFSGISMDDAAKYVAPVRNTQSKEAVMTIYKIMRHYPKIKFKDSIRKVVGI